MAEFADLLETLEEMMIAYHNDKEYGPALFTAHQAALDHVDTLRAERDAAAKEPEELRVGIAKLKDEAKEICWRWEVSNIDAKQERDAAVKQLAERDAQLKSATKYAEEQLANAHARAARLEQSELKALAELDEALAREAILKDALHTSRYCDQDDPEVRDRIDAAIATPSPVAGAIMDLISTALDLDEAMVIDDCSDWKVQERFQVAVRAYREALNQPAPTSEVTK